MCNEVVEALQLSGKIPALGAGGPGSIPGEALFAELLRLPDDSYEIYVRKECEKLYEID